ncbi:MAG: hypothetical protein H7A07_10930 [Pseudomonadales bacterium]|nr:hypothetical protein [Pseudomonadales bacterium]
MSTNEVGIYAEPKTVKVGEPLTLSAQAQDRGIRVGYADVLPYYDLGSYWVMHQGPAEPVIETPEISARTRAANNPIDPNVNPWIDISTQVTFPEPGDYVIRLRVDNFAAPDSQFDNVCCWSNAYYPVTVTP